MTSKGSCGFSTARLSGLISHHTPLPLSASGVPITPLYSFTLVTLPPAMGTSIGATFLSLSKSYLYRSSQTAPQEGQVGIRLATRQADPEPHVKERQPEREAPVTVEHEVTSHSRQRWLIHCWVPGPIHVNLNPGCSRFSEPLRLLVLYTPHSAARGDPNKIREKHKKALTLKSAGFNHNSN